MSATRNKQRPSPPGRREILPAIEAVGRRFQSAGRDTVLFDNRGKHALELGLILEALRGAGGRVLDVGGGLGVNLLALRRLLAESELCLVDRFEEYTESNKMGAADNALGLLREAGVEVRNQDFWQTPALPCDDASFDVVTIFDVVEHLPGHPLRLLGEIRRVLRPGGALLLSGPNSHSAMSFAKMLAGRHPYIDFEAWTSESYYSHYREYRPHEYRALLVRAGFAVDRIFLTAEPWRTRARTGYHRGFLRPTSPRFYAVHAMHLLQSAVPRLRENVYCVAERPG